MNPIEKNFIPFPHLVIPVVENCVPSNAIALARELGGELTLIGLVSVSEADSLSAGTMAARRLRKHMEVIRAEAGLPGTNQVEVSHSPWDDLQQVIRASQPDLLILESPVHFECLEISPKEALARPACNIVVLRGKWPEQPQKRILLPLRGGPYAELALRMALALEKTQITALHLIGPDTTPETETPFRGLARILPSIPEILYKSMQSSSPVQTILSEAANSDLLVIGAGANPGFLGGMGQVSEELIEKLTCPVMVVKSYRPHQATWSGEEGERAGYQAISVLVDKWFAENTYHADEFDNLELLVELKQRQNLTISLALPALNEEETVGEVIGCVKKALMDDVPLLDEIVLIDSNSTDKTRTIASSFDIPVYIHQELLPKFGGRIGKGEALWKSLQVTRGDIILWIDTDIVNIHPRFVYGVIGPLLVNPKLQLVKGFYQRPLRSGEVTTSTGGGRVTELTARPLLNMFYPELSGVLQPLSGEYGGRRSAFEQMSFFSGYGVETGLLIDAFEKYGLSSIAQVDLLERIHHNQSLEALSKMSFTILQAFIRKLEKRFNAPILEEVNKTMKLIRYEEGNYYLEVQEVAEHERPPMISVTEYREKHNQKAAAE